MPNKIIKNTELTVDEELPKKRGRKAAVVLNDINNTSNDDVKVLKKRVRKVKAVDEVEDNGVGEKEEGKVLKLTKKTTVKRAIKSRIQKVLAEVEETILTQGGEDLVKQKNGMITHPINDEKKEPIISITENEQDKMGGNSVSESNLTHETGQPRPRFSPEQQGRFSSQYVQDQGRSAYTADSRRNAPANQQDSETNGYSEDEMRMTGAERKRMRFLKWKEKRNKMRQERMSQLRSEPGRFDSESFKVQLGEPVEVEGLVELTIKGYGFLRTKDRNYQANPQNPHLSIELIRKFGLREASKVSGVMQQGPRGMIVTEIKLVNNREAVEGRALPFFEELKAVNPNKRIQFETVSDRMTTRVVDLLTPVGRGQRGLIVAPPRTGKTTFLHHLAEGVQKNHPTMPLIILLVDERPEEVTDFKKKFENAEIFSSSNDQDVRSHTSTALYAIERAKRLVEQGEHVFFLMDSITRLARAFNNAKQGGATMSGGMGVGAMEIPRRLFAAARNTRTAGSLTILATALIETGSRMDDLIFQEFKGTGNMEVVLDRKIAEQYIYPAVNIGRSGTRREELILPAFQLEKIHWLRRGLANMKPVDSMLRTIQLLERYDNNSQMLLELSTKYS
jgi:transcription termination factor Rho